MKQKNRSRTPTQGKLRQLQKIAWFSVLLFAISVWITLDCLFSPFSENGMTVTVPDFCGRVPEESLFAEWMDVEIEYREGEDGTEGTVISQTPAAGSNRKISPKRETCRIVLYVSTGKTALTVPEVLGMDVREAASLLRRQGFAVEISRFPDARPEGEVIASSPTAGKTAQRGDVILLSVSSGTPSESVRVPDLCGMTRSEALVTLWRCGLRAASVIEEDAPGSVAGTVIGQSHRGGTLVSSKTGIVLYVASQNSE